MSDAETQLKEYWIEACTAPGYRKIVSVLKAPNAVEAIRLSKAYHQAEGHGYVRFCAMSGSEVYWDN